MGVKILLMSLKLSEILMGACCHDVHVFNEMKDQGGPDPSPLNVQ